VDPVIHRGGSIPNPALPVSPTPINPPLDQTPNPASSYQPLQPTSSYPHNSDPPDDDPMEFNTYAEFMNWFRKPDPTLNAILQQYKKS